MPVALELIVSILVFYGCVHIEGATVNCPTPVSPENGQLTLYNQGKIVKYVCDPGYILQGTSIVQCVQNQWTSPPPVCNPEGKISTYDYSCYQRNHRQGYNRAPLIPDADVLRIESRRNPRPPYNYYMSVGYVCRKGFHFRDSKVTQLFCSNRTWVGEKPICDDVGVDPISTYDYSCHRFDNRGEIQTTEAPQIANAIKSHMESRRNPRNPFNFYLSVRYFCKQGYRLRDNRVFQLFCSNRSWVGETPVCDPTEKVRDCNVGKAGCEQRCINSQDGYFEKCACYVGFALASDNVSCKDVDECAEGNFGCSHTCHNTRGSATCKCPKGFTLGMDGKNCEDVDECKDERLNACGHRCINAVGSYTCSCLPGYILMKDSTCEGCRKNSYQTDSGSCEECPLHSHTEGEGKTSIADCLCDDGFFGDPSTGHPCADIDECEDGNFGCSDGCVNTPGSAFCSCPNGFHLETDQKTCIDIDECAVKNGGCQGSCINLVGNFECRCPEGFTPSEKDIYSCDDIDECSKGNASCGQICNNFPGGYFCSCEPGFRLDNTQKNCIPVTCPRIAEPRNSVMRCGATASERRNSVSSNFEQDFPFETICTFKCKAGYNLSSSDRSTISCNETGHWEGTVPECVVLQCPPLKPPSNGRVDPKACSRRGSDILRKCVFVCDPGYKLEGPFTFTCRRTLNWSPNTPPKCVKESPLPHITCPPDISAELSLGSNSIHLHIPRPFGNVEDAYISVTPAWVNGDNASFPFGVTDVVYTARSPTDGNVTATCTTTVTVIDKEAPAVMNCPSSFDVKATSFEGVTVHWEEPQFTDNIGVVFTAKSLEPNITLNPGIHAVNYFARDAAGNTAECLFFINITSLECSDPIGPLHGEANCMDWSFGRICQPNCDPGYTFYADEPPLHMCDDSGSWSPSRKIPDCTKFSVTSESECPTGSEFRIHVETDETICVECPRDMIWSSDSGICVDAADFEDSAEIQCENCEITEKTADIGNDTSSTLK